MVEFVRPFGATERTSPVSENSRPPSRPASTVASAPKPKNTTEAALLKHFAKDLKAMASEEKVMDEIWRMGRKRKF